MIGFFLLLTSFKGVKTKLAVFFFSTPKSHCKRSVKV